MPDLKDELDALFDDEEKPQEEEAEKKSEGSAEDDKAKAAARKAKMAAVGARTGGVAARKIPGKAAAPTRAKGPEPEPEPEPPHVHVPAGRAASAHTPSGGGGGLVKILLVVSLLLNVLILVFALNLLGQMGKMQEQMQTINRNVTSSTTMSRAEVGIYTDRGGVDTAILFYLPTDVNKFPQEGKAWRVPLDRLLQNATRE